MVIVRAGRVEHLQEQQIQHLRRRQQLEQHTAVSVSEAAAKMFKIPSSSHSSQPNPSFAQHQQSELKRKWQEAFIQRGELRDTMLNLATPERPQQRQKTPPLTIFYAGSVNVYDNVPEDMVRALMTLAASKSSRPAAATAMLNQLGRINGNNGSSLNTYGFPVLSHAQNHHHVHQQQQSSSAHVAGFPVVSQLNHGTNSHNNNSSNGNSNINKNSFSNFLSIGPSNNVGGSSASGFSTFHNTSLSLNSFRMEEKQSSAAALAAPVVQVQSMVGAGSTTTVTPASTTTSTTTVTTTPTTSTGPNPNPASDLRRMSQLSPTTRMQLLPAGLPQARRASIQRFLEKRKQKQVNNNNNNNQDEEAGGAGGAGSGGASASASSASADKSSPGREEAAGTQVPHFLRRSS